MEALNRKIVLLKIEPAAGIGGERVIETKLVWANASEMTIKAKNSAAEQGKRAELIALVLRGEFDGHTHAEVSGKRFKIEQSGKADNDLLVKLTLAAVASVSLGSHG